MTVWTELIRFAPVMGEWEVGGSGSGLLNVIDKPRVVGTNGVLMEMGSCFGRMLLVKGEGLRRTVRACFREV